MAQNKNWRRVSKKDFFYKERRKHIYDIFTKKKTHMNAGAKIFLVVYGDVQDSKHPFKVSEMSIVNNQMKEVVVGTAKTYPLAISKCKSLMR